MQSTHSTLVDWHASELRLLNLPRELLEEISLWLPADQTVQPMLANSLLHSVFSRRLWETYGLATQKKSSRISESAWLRYGHLVRRADISSSYCVETVLGHICEVVRLTVELGYLPIVLDSNHHGNQLRMMQHVTVIHRNNTLLDVKYAKVVKEWIDHAAQRDQRVTFEWMLPVIGDDQFRLLCEMADILDDASIHRFTVYVQNCQSPGQFATSTFAAMTKQLTASSGESSYDLLSNMSSSYTRLSWLELTLDSSVPSDECERIVSIKPDNFPSLQQLTVSYLLDNTATIAQRLFSQPLHTVTGFVIAWCEDSSVLEHCIQRLPSVVKLRLLACKFPVNIRAIATHLPRIHSLAFDGEDYTLTDVSWSSNTEFPLLTELSFAKHALAMPPAKPEYLTLALLCAPRLLSLRLVGYYVAAHDVELFKRRASSSVKLLNIERYRRRLQMEQIDSIVTLFPRANRLTLQHASKANKQAIQAKYPHLVVIPSQLQPI